MDEGKIIVQGTPTEIVKNPQVIETARGRDMADSVISVHSLDAGYAKSHVLFGVDFEAQKWKITVII